MDFALILKSLCRDKNARIRTERTFAARAILASDEVQMAEVIRAVEVGFARCVAAHAATDHFTIAAEIHDLAAIERI